jgi:hypothetical protein
MQKIIKKTVPLFGLLVAVSLSSLLYVAPAEAGCHSWDKACRWAREQRQRAQHEIDRLAGVARHTAEQAAKDAQHAAEIAAKVAQHNAEVAAAAAKHAYDAHGAELAQHGVGLAHQIADSTAEELHNISKMIGSLSPIKICEQSATVLYEQAAEASCGFVAEALVSELCVIGTSPTYSPANQGYCSTMASVAIPSMRLAGLSSCLAIEATGTSKKFNRDWATTIAQETCKIIPR